MTAITNPFEYGKPITNPDRFIGRYTELIRIRDALYKLRSVSIVGERRAGKSSLLRQFANPELIQQHGFDLETCLLCFVDLQGLEDIEPAQFWELILPELANKLSSDVSNIDRINSKMTPPIIA